MTHSSVCKAIFIASLPFLVSLWGIALFGQESINNASIGGRVADASGAAIDNAQVSVRQLETNVTSIINTDRDGRFRFPYLKVGPYELKVHKDGFADQIRNLTLTIGSAFDLPVALGVASTQTSVTVSGDADGPRSRAIPDCRHRLEGRNSAAPFERPKLPRRRPARPRSFADQYGA